MYSSLPPTGLDEADLFVWTMWSIWKSRNKFVFENEFISVEETLLRSILGAKEWQSACINTRRKGLIQAENEELIRTPDTVCFSDAAWKNATLPCGIGLDFRDDTDESILQIMDTKSFISSALEAEACSLYRGLREAKERGIEEIHFCSDSKTLINAIVKDQDRIEISNYLWDIKELAAEFKVISFRFVPRLANVVADSLAKQALSEFECMSHFT